jgi:hypothetical protein
MSKKKTIIWVSIIVFYAGFSSFILQHQKTNCDGEKSNLSGIYLVPENILEWSYLRGLGVDLDEISAMEIEQSESMLTATFVWKKDRPPHRALDKGYIKFKNTDVNWNEGTLVFERFDVGFGGIFPGFGSQTANLYLTQTDEGDLAIKTTAGEKGLMLFLIPFIDQSKIMEIILKRRNNFQPELSLPR